MRSLPLYLALAVILAAAIPTEGLAKNKGSGCLADRLRICGTQGRSVCKLGKHLAEIQSPKCRASILERRAKRQDDEDAEEEQAGGQGAAAAEAAASAGEGSCDDQGFAHSFTLGSSATVTMSARKLISTVAQANTIATPCTTM